LTIGRNQNNGTYNLTSGSLTAAFEEIGSSSIPTLPLSGLFQSGGVHRVLQELHLGDEGAGLLSLSGGTLVAAKLTMGIGGTLDLMVDPATNHLVINGVAALSGALTVRLPDGLRPLGGDTFTLLTYGSRLGTFGTTNFPPSFNGVVWTLDYKPKALILRA